MFSRLQEQWDDACRLFRAIPSVTMMLFVVSVIVTNLMAAKFIVYTPHVQVTGGLLLSWLPFLCMDMTAKHFGPMASIKLNLFGLLMYLCCVGFFQLVVAIQYTPAAPGADYSAFAAIYGALWKVLLASSAAFVVSGVVNAAAHDLLLSPVTACPPVPNAGGGNTLGPAEIGGVPVEPLIGWCMTFMANFTGHPAASVPAGRLPAGLPAAVQLMAPKTRDADLFAAARARERLAP